MFEKFVTDPSVTPADHPYHKPIYVSNMNSNGEQTLRFIGWSPVVQKKDGQVLAGVKGTSQMKVVAFESRDMYPSLPQGRQRVTVKHDDGTEGAVYVSNSEMVGR